MVNKRRKRRKKDERSSVSESYLRRGLLWAMAFCMLFFAVIGGRIIRECHHDFETRSEVLQGVSQHLGY